MFRQRSWMKNLTWQSLDKKGKWYDHKVSVTDVQEQTEEEKNAVEIGEEEKSEDADTTTDAAAEEENKD